MKQHIENTRRQLGELGVMAHQTDAMERKILARAEALLADVEKKIETTRQRALVPGADEAMQYQDLIMERGRLHQVIAQAKAILSGT